MAAALHPSVVSMDEAFVVGGKMTAEELRAAVEAHGIKGIVQLAEWPEPLGKDLSAASGVGSAFSAVPAEDGFSAGAADGACKAIADAERPTLVLCASGARASAAVAIFQAREHHTTPQDAVADGIARNLRWADMAVLRHWVVTGIQAEESRRLAAVHASLRRVSEDLFAGGTMSAEELRAAVSTSGVRTVIQLVPFPEPYGESLRDALPEDVATEFVPAGPPSSEYSAEAAARAIAKVQAAAKPVLVVCVSGNRAEALADMASAEAEGLNATQLAERATAAGRVWPTRDVVAEWVKVTLPAE